MLARTWPIGTKKAVRVIECRRCQHEGKPVRVMACEGYVLLDSADLPLVPIGDLGTITFTVGGPTGGHWVYTSDAGT